MQLRPQSIRATADGIEIDGPDGPVLLRRQDAPGGDRIVAEYTGRELVNGSARAYAQSQLKRALQYAATYPLPWSYDAQGRQRITDHSEFYQQTFNPDLRGIERLRLWGGRGIVGQSCLDH